MWALRCRYGSLVRLLTEEPPRLAEADLVKLQRGMCAACRSPLPPPAKPSGFLGGRSATTVSAPTCRPAMGQMRCLPEGSHLNVLGSLLLAVLVLHGKNNSVRVCNPPVLACAPMIMQPLKMPSCGLQGPRKCEYNGRLYCHECHRGDVAELPARVLHHWDFSPQPASAMAADYLASISDRPLLCIGAVNPGKRTSSWLANDCERQLDEHCALYCAPSGFSSQV